MYYMLYGMRMTLLTAKDSPRLTLVTVTLETEKVRFNSVASWPK